MNGTKYLGKKRSSSKHPSIVCFPLSFCWNILFKIANKFDTLQWRKASKATDLYFVKVLFKLLGNLRDSMRAPNRIWMETPLILSSKLLPKNHWVLLQKLT